MRHRRALGARHHTIFRMIHTIFRMIHTIFRMIHTIFIRLFPSLTLRWLRFLPALRKLLRAAQPSRQRLIAVPVIPRASAHTPRD